MCCWILKAMVADDWGEELNLQVSRQLFQHNLG